MFIFLNDLSPYKTIKFLREVWILLCCIRCAIIINNTAKPRPKAHMDMILFEVFLKSIDLIPQQNILQRHYLYYRWFHCTLWSCGIKWIFFKNTLKRIMSMRLWMRFYGICNPQPPFLFSACWDVLQIVHAPDLLANAYSPLHIGSTWLLLQKKWFFTLSVFSSDHSQHFHLH